MKHFNNKLLRIFIEIEGIKLVIYPISAPSSTRCPIGRRSVVNLKINPIPKFEP